MKQSKTTQRTLSIFVFTLTLATKILASDFLFISVPYLQLTKRVASEADRVAPGVFGEGPLLEKYQRFRTTLIEKVDETQRKRLQKKITAEIVTDTNDKAFSDALNAFKDALNAMSQKAIKPLSDLLPSYTKWAELETIVVKTGLEKRLSAYQTRFGSDSEPINILELYLGEKFLPGDESGPSAWEPIVRFSAVQVSSRGDAVTSGFEWGANYYFVKQAAPKPLQYLGVSNHVGVAATLQYLEDPGAFNFEGKPAFGVVVHLDRKVAGVSWDSAEDKLRVTIGYALQFVPFVF